MLKSVHQEAEEAAGGEEGEGPGVRPWRGTQPLERNTAPAESEAAPPREPPSCVVLVFNLINLFVLHTLVPSF